MYLLLYLTLSAQPRVRHWIWLSIPLAMAILTLTETAITIACNARLNWTFSVALFVTISSAIMLTVFLWGEAWTVLEFFSVVGVYGIITTPMPYHTLWATLWFFLTVLVLLNNPGSFPIYWEVRYSSRGSYPTPFT